MLTGAVAPQCLQPIARQRGKVAERLRAVQQDQTARRLIGEALKRRADACQATAPRPFFATSVRSFRDAPRGRFSPRSHWLTRPVVTFR